MNASLNNSSICVNKAFEDELTIALYTQTIN